VVIVSLILIGVFLSGCGKESKSGEITAKEIADQQKVITQYYGYIDQGKYKDAYALTTVGFQRGLSYDNFVYQYREYVKSVKVIAMNRLKQFSDKNNGAFNVALDPSYRKKYPYGDGQLPQVHVLQRENPGSAVWKIDSIGVGRGE